MVLKAKTHLKDTIKNLLYKLIQSNDPEPNKSNGRNRLSSHHQTLNQEGVLQNSANSLELAESLVKQF